MVQSELLCFKSIRADLDKLEYHQKIYDFVQKEQIQWKDLFLLFHQFVALLNC